MLQTDGFVHQTFVTTMSFQLTMGNNDYPENHEELLKSNYARSKTQFPLIRFHQDMVARCLGLVPGDIIEITRPSFSAGEYVSYRTCVP